VRDVAGFDPYPGTLNVCLADGEELRRWRAIRDEAAVPVIPPRSEDCGGRLVPLLLGEGIRAAIVVPDVTRHGADLLEIIAPVHLRTRFDLRDGDPLSLRIDRPLP
jgi:riboflavin kinase